MAKSALITATLCILVSACSKDIVTTPQYLGELPSSPSVVEDFVVTKQGILPLMTIVAVPDSASVDLWDLDQSEVWPECAVVTLCDSAGILMQWVSDVSSVDTDHEVWWHRPGRETHIMGPISYYRDFQLYSDLWKKDQSSFYAVDLMGELIPDGSYNVEVRWDGFEPSPYVRHYELHFYNRKKVPEWRLWFD